MREELEGLEDHPDAATLGGHPRGGSGDDLAVDLDAALVGVGEPRDEAEQRGLARAARAEDDRGRARRDVELDAVEHAPAAERLRDAGETDEGGAHFAPRRAASARSRIEASKTLCLGVPGSGAAS